MGIPGIYAHDNYMLITGYKLRHGDPPYFLWGKNLHCRLKNQKVREADDSGIVEDLLKNSERNPSKSKTEIVYKPAYDL